MKNRIHFLSLLSCLMLLFWAGKPDGQRAKAKVMEKNFVSVSAHLFAGKYEVSNINYKEFLASFKDNSPQYQTFEVRSQNWVKYMKNADPLSENYFSHPAFDEYPVVNVTHEAAKAYCAWLTELYHSDPKRTYEKVVFRLPTAEEWETAAKAGQETTNYAWEGPYLRNVKGKYLCNFTDVPQQMITRDENNKVTLAKDAKYSRAYSDQYTITSPVDRFPANDFGLYNMCGNAAEMLEDAGIARGGCWRDLGYDVRIQSERKYTESSPYIGFRVFMEVIEP